MTEKKTAAKGVHVGWILLGAAVVGTVAGLVIAERSQSAFEAELDDMQAQAEKLMPMGAPLEPRRSSADPMAPDPASLRGLPAYPGALPRRMMTTPRGQGIPMAVSWFQTFDTAEQVLSYYEKRFNQDQIPAVSGRYTPNQGYVAWLERPKVDDGGLPEGVLHMVSAIQQGKQTTVLLSASEPQRMLQAAPQLPEGVVLPPGAGQPFVMEQSELGLERQSIFAKVNSSADQVVSFYEARYGEAGWKVHERADGDKRRSIVFTRGDRTQMIVAEQEGEGAELLITNQRRPGAGQEVVQ